MSNKAHFVNIYRSHTHTIRYWMLLNGTTHLHEMAGVDICLTDQQAHQGGVMNMITN